MSTIMGTIRLVSERKTENGDLRMLIAIGDMMAEEMSKQEIESSGIVSVWGSCVVGIRHDREFLAPLLFVGNSMAEQLDALEQMSASGMAQAWHNTVKRVRQ